MGLRLTDVPNLPDQMDSTSTNLTGIIAVNELLYVWQMCCDSEATSHYKDVLTVVHGNTLPVRSAKQHPGIYGVPALGMP
jgi:hypothetical protein